VLRKCIWGGPGDTKVILTLADAQHMQMTMAAQERSGANTVTGVGSPKQSPSSSLSDLDDQNTR
jgi:hypothetical protein